MTDSKPQTKRLAFSGSSIPTSFHPAEFIWDELEARGWSMQHLYDRLPQDDGGATRLSIETYMATQDPDIAMDENMANALHGVFGVSAQFFLNLHKSWKDSLDQSEHASRPTSAGRPAAGKPAR